MKAKRYTVYEYTGKGVLAVEENTTGKYVLATDYDALLALARRLRIELVSYAKDAPVMCDDIELLDDSAWLEE